MGKEEMSWGEEESAPENAVTLCHRCSDAFPSNSKPKRTS